MSFRNPALIIPHPVSTQRQWQAYTDCKAYKCPPAGMQMHGVQQQLKDLPHLGATAFGQNMLMLIAMLHVHRYTIQRSPGGLHDITARDQRLSRAWGSRIRPAHARALRHAWRAHARPGTAWRCPHSRSTPDRCAAPAWSSCTAKAMTHCSACACDTSSASSRPFIVHQRVLLAPKPAIEGLQWTCGQCLASLSDLRQVKQLPILPTTLVAWPDCSSLCRRQIFQITDQKQETLL